MTRQQRNAWTAAASLLVLGALSYPATGAQKAAQDAAFGPLATPEGIMIQPLGIAQGYSLNKETATKLPRERLVYANADGMTLYANDMDTAGKSSCVDACAKTWPPALAPADAKPVEGWSVIARADGTHQWAVDNKPLYAYSQDVDVGSVGGNSPKRFARGPAIGPRGRTSASIPKDKALPSGWHEAYMFPIANASLPAGFTIREVEDAMALVLLDESTERTLYVFDGDPAKSNRACATEACRSLWAPLAAPRLALPSGDFGVGRRDDGVTQWTYKGRAVYTFTGDLAFGDANGIGVDKRFQVAAVKRYFVPADISVQFNPKLGKLLATVSGQTLYRRNSHINQSGSGHSLRRGDPIRPAVGRDLGPNPHCDVDCDKWHPFLAPVSAKAWGDWSVVTRPDGKKQWASRGYALWMYDGDKRPGDINGNDSYRLVMSHDDRTVPDIGTYTDGISALFWIAASP